MASNFMESEANLSPPPNIDNRRTSLRAQDYIDHEILSASEIASSRVSPMIHPKDERIYLKMFSKYSEEDVLVSDFRPIDKEQRDLFKYICPICMRYFNSKNEITFL
jgi:hypothetical protein